MRLRNLITALTLSLFYILLACSQEQPEVNKANTETVKDKSIPVEAYIVKKEHLQQNFIITGVVQAIHSVDIVSEVSGKVMSINKDLGQTVSKRDTLAFIDHKIPYSQYRQAEAQYLSAKNNLQIARLNLESDKLLFENGDISSLAFQNSELTGKNAEANLLAAKSGLAIAEKAYKDTRITSPFSGQISRSYLDLGKMVQPGMPLYHVVDLSTLKIEVGLPQDVIGSVHIGAGAEIKFAALGKETFSGKVKFISPQADERSGNFIAEIHLSNPENSGLRAGMTAKINLLITDMREMISVPDEAVIEQNGSAAVYKIQKNIARLTDVETSWSSGTKVVIDRGIAVGDTIVTVGHKKLGLDSKIVIESIN